MTQVDAPSPAVGRPRDDDSTPASHTDRTWISRHAHHVGLAALLVGTAILYLWDLTASGYANSFYAGAVQAGSQNWKAWFFGSLDTSNFITVDKPPASLWVMGLSGRIFGFSSASMLIPQALMGVGTVALAYAAVKRVATPGAGLLAGAVLALTPAAALMFKFNNPDALLVLLMTLGAYFVIRSVQTEIGKRAAMWLALAGVALGFAFLTKMLQGLLVLPAFGLVYLVAGQSKFVARIVHLLGAAVALVISGGWWVVITIIWPADSRPYFGGSTNNSVMDLVLGYNGLGRIFGQERGGGGGGDAARAMPSGGGGFGPGGGQAGSSFGGPTGLDRLFGSEMGFEISWLIPAALAALVFGLIARGRAPRTDLMRASLILWGGWFIVTGVIFSYMSGTVHPYYTVALAPSIAGLIGTGSYALWQKRSSIWGRLGLASITAASGISAWVLLNRNATWLPALKWIIVVAALLAAVALIIGKVHRVRALTIGVVALAIVSGLGGTAAYAIATSSQPHTGSIPSVGPSGNSAFGGFGGGPGGAGGGPGGAGGNRAGGFTPPAGDGTPAAGAPDARSGGGMGGFGGGQINAQLIQMLKDAGTRWAAATNGSTSAADIELASNTPVMAIGGFSGDPAPTLDQFIAYVKSGDVHYYIGGSGGGPGGNAEISSWVSKNFTAQTIGSSTVYDLSGYTG